MRNLHLPVIAALLATVVGGAPVCCACSVPVFRYALEQWQPDNYQLYLFHRGDLSKKQQALADRLAPRSLSEDHPANVQLTRVNLDDDPRPEFVQLWEAQQSETLPLLVVQLPHKVGPPVTVWSGELREDHVDRLLDSPVRKEVAQRIVKGDSVVWVLLESGNQEQDDAAFAVLQKELKRLQTEIKLPELKEEDLKSLTIDPESLKLKFSAVRVSRDDPAERLFVRMLLRVEPDLLDPELAGKTMAFPVFGRGRALYSLVGAGIAGDVIEDACRFLAGACQCTVKAQNPGVDILMSVDWNELVQPTMQEKPLPPLAGLTGFGVSELFPEEVTVAKPTSTDAKKDSTDPAPAETAKPKADVSTREVTAAEPANPAPVNTASVPVPETDDVSSSNFGLSALMVAMALLVIAVIGTVALAPRQN